MCSITIYQAALTEKADNALFVLDFSPSLNQPRLTAEQSDLVVCESHSKGPFRARKIPDPALFIVLRQIVPQCKRQCLKLKLMNCGH